MTELYLEDGEGKILGKFTVPPDHPFANIEEPPEYTKFRTEKCCCLFCGVNLSLHHRTWGGCGQCGRTSEGLDRKTGEVAEPKYRRDGSLMVLAPDRFDVLRKKLEEIKSAVKVCLERHVDDALLEHIIDDIWMKSRQLESQNFTDGSKGARQWLKLVNESLICLINNWHKDKDVSRQTLKLVSKCLNSIIFETV